MSLPDNKKQLILEKIKEKINLIDPSSGEYNFSYENKVYLYKTSTFIDFGINILDTEETNSNIQESSDTYWDNTIEVDIDIVCPDSSYLENIYKYEADILKCIGNNLTWDNLAINTQYIGSYRNKVDQLGNKIGDMTIRLQIKYRKNAWGK